MKKRTKKQKKAESIISTPCVPFKPGDQCSGFAIEKISPLPSLGCVAVQAKHEHSKARVLHIYAPHDRENCFAVAFRTPPPDDSGVAHILEHAVLGGSRKYPVKDPFMEMLKMSMATFLNAMTYPDKTVYPVASNVIKDYFNLVEVYCDAVLNPRISPMTLKQEGHHLAFVDPENMKSPLITKGIDYNEMKGAYSDFDSLIERKAMRALFPQSPYGNDSGGDPPHIRQLSYEEFVAFFRHFYHPANAWFFLYGDIPTACQLKFLDARLRAVPEPPSIRSELPMQPTWEAPREEEIDYPVDPGDDLDAKHAVTVNWLVGDVTDPVVDLAMEVIDRLLLG
ncbi:MAG: insulinase family protein, partial [Candidatus Pacebacteria bacterium]|nr:insulinase family protein [Candidatus Paceibacterota bacterium]